MESCGVDSFVTGFFHPAWWCLWDSSKLVSALALHSFLSLNLILLYTCTTVHLFTHQSMFGWFSVWGDYEYMCCEHLCPDLCLNLPNHMVYVRFKKLPNYCFPKCLCHFCIPTSNMWEFQLLFIFTSTWYVGIFYLSQSHKCIAVCHCGFNLHCPNG